MLAAHPMQLTRAYREQLDPRFVNWYLETFTNTRRIYGHWSATGRCSLDGAYHREVEEKPDGVVYVANPSNVALTDFLGGHTDGRNSDATALCVASEGQATTSDIGPYAATPAELHAFVGLAAQVCINLHAPVSNMMTHAEAANNVDFPSVDAPGIPAPPSYGPGSRDFERWDWHVRINTTTLAMVPLFDGATAIYPPERLPHGPLNARAEAMPAGWEYFPDWWRGQTALCIQALTRQKWSA